MNSRCQVDLIDMQLKAYEDYTWILDYQDHLTKFTFLLPLKTKKAREVADKLSLIFSIIGPPCILQMDNGGEFKNKVVRSLAKKFNGLEIVHGSPKASQSQGSVERNNREINKMVTTWMTDNATKNWSKGLRCIQGQQNRALNTGIGRSPHETMYGHPQMNGLADRSIPHEVLSNIKTCEELEKMLEENFVLERTSNESTAVASGNNDIEMVETLCIICESPINEATSCAQCGFALHAICGFCIDNKGAIDSKIECLLCYNKINICIQRAAAKKSLEKQAIRMLKRLNDFLPSVEKGKTVLVGVPDIQRAPTAPRNLMAVVVDVNDENLYQLGTQYGLLDKLYKRNEFTSAKCDHIDPSVVTPNKKIKLGAALALSSKTNQVHAFCQCKRRCTDKRCSCSKNAVLCNSKCHGSNVSTNK